MIGAPLNPGADRGGEDATGSLVAFPVKMSTPQVPRRPAPTALASTADGPSLLDVVLRRPKLLVIGAVLFGLLGLALVASNLSSYNASARVILRDPWDADIGATDRPVGGDFQRFVRSEARFMQTDEVLSTAADTLGERPGVLAGAVQATASGSGDFIDVVVAGSSAEQAEARLDALLEAYSSVRLSVVAEQADLVLATIEEEAASLQGGDRTELERRATDLRIALAAYGDGVSFVEQAPASADMGLLQKVGIPLFASLFGLGLASVAAWVWATRYPRIERPELLAQDWGMNFCGTVSTRAEGSSPLERTAAEAVLLALAGTLRQAPPLSPSGTYVVVLVAATGDTPTLAAGRQLVEATHAQGAVARVIDVAGSADPNDSIDVAAQLAAETCDLLLFACGVPQRDFTALRIAANADAVVLVVPEGSAADDVTQTLTFFDNVGHHPRALVATSQKKAPRS